MRLLGGCFRSRPGVRAKGSSSGQGLGDGKGSLRFYTTVLQGFTTRARCA